MRNWIWALVLTVGALALVTNDANAQVFRRGGVASYGYNTYYYPSYVTGYNYPVYPSGYVYSSGYTTYAPTYIAPSYSYGYPSYVAPSYGYPAYYGTRGVGVYTSPYGTGVTVGGRVMYSSGYGGYGGYGYGGYRGGYAPGRYYR